MKPRHAFVFASLRRIQAAPAPKDNVDEDRDDEWLDAQRVRNFLLEQLTKHAAKPAGDLSKLGMALRLTGEQCEWGPTADFAEKAAEQLQRVAGLVTNADAESLLRRLRGFAARQPGLFMGSAVLLGLGGGRFLRSSAPSDAPGAIGRAQRKQRAGPKQPKQQRTE